MRKGEASCDLHKAEASRAMHPAQLIALDWGSSSLRACLMGRGGAVIGQRSSEAGASRLQADAAGFERRLHELVGDWLDAANPLPMLACGMVGSAHGWREAPYLNCPASLADLGANAVGVQSSVGWTLRIVTGVAQRAPGDAPDVMRGEETQIAGLVAGEPRYAEGSVVVLPGTHSKWVDVCGGSIVGFGTYMTGELFAVLCEHSVLGRLMAPSGDFDAAAFDRGVQSARGQRGAGLGRLLFSVRTLGLFDELPRTSLADYLSGLLIGSELAGALPRTDPGLPLVLAGEPALCEKYRRALGLFDRGATLAPSQLAARGLWQIAVLGGWVAH